jgi:hypothetical protein
METKGLVLYSRSPAILIDAGVIEDDGPEIVLETRYSHVRVAHRPEAKIVVRCTEVLP